MPSMGGPQLTTLCLRTATVRSTILLYSWSSGTYDIVDTVHVSAPPVNDPGLELRSPEGGETDRARGPREPKHGIVRS